MGALVFCASDYVAAWGGIELVRRRGLRVDVVAGSVTDSQMGEDYIEKEFGVPAANARRNGAKLFELVKSRVSNFEFPVSLAASGSELDSSQLPPTDHGEGEG